MIGVRTGRHKSNMGLKIRLALVGAGLLLAACGSSPTSPSDSSLVIEDLIVGTGVAASAGDTLTVQYIGTLLDGSKFDSSYDHGVPFTFRLGAGQVIAGWDQGLLGMRIGGKRRLTIPPSLGYGSQAAGPIPPNSTLRFDIDLLAIAGK